MNAMQLEFNINNETEFEIKIGDMQKQIKDLNEKHGQGSPETFC